MDASSQHCSEELDMAASSQLFSLAKANSSSCDQLSNAYKKSSHASVRTTTNATTRSKSVSSPLDCWIAFAVAHYDEMNNSYTYENVVGTAIEYDDKSKHDNVKASVQTWLEKVCTYNVYVKIDGKVSKKRLFVTDECLLAFNTNDPDKITDLAIYGSGSRNLPYLQLEVQSSAKPVSEGPSKSKKPAIDGSRKSTIRKLGYSLVDQLIFLRNRCDGELPISVSGIYVPIVGAFELVLCEWEDDDLRFNITTEVIEQGEVLDVINKAITKATEQPRLSNSTDFAVPLNKRSSFITSIGQGAYQYRSGACSIVIGDENNVYKYPMGSYERRRLSELMDMDRIPELTQYFAIPILVQKLRAFQFFKYNKYNAPLGAREIKPFFKVFMRVVSGAVEALHSFGFAHLDLRLDNICFSDRNAVLIDLDRSVEVDKEFKKVLDYGESTMYKKPDCVPLSSCTARHLDWKQLAIMGYYILSSGTMECGYHDITVPSDNMMYEMYTKGEFIVRGVRDVHI